MANNCSIWRQYFYSDWHPHSSASVTSLITTRTDLLWHMPQIPGGSHFMLQTDLGLGFLRDFSASWCGRQSHEVWYTAVESCDSQASRGDRRGNSGCHHWQPTHEDLFTPATFPNSTPSEDQVLGHMSCGGIYIQIMTFPSMNPNIELYSYYIFTTLCYPFSKWFYH